MTAPRPDAATSASEPVATAASGPAAAAPVPGRQATVVPVRTLPAALPTAEPLDDVENGQLGRLRRWGTVGALLLMVGSTSSYGAASPIPNPVDGLRVLGLLSRVGPAALACSATGIGLLVVCWFLIGRLAAPGRPRRLSRRQLSTTLAMWAVPLMVTPPIFSRDVYSYLAVGQMMAQGDNPYSSGPYDTLGDADPFAHQVDARWQHTASPYGPAFLLIARGVVTVVGDHVVLGVLLQRLVEVTGVAMIVWALPRLARRFGLDPVAALWLGALNPLVLFHLVAGAHNEALMIGGMLAGLVLALPGPQAATRWRAGLPGVITGTALITVAVGIKITAALALAFLVVALARRSGGRWPDLFRWAGLVGAVAVGTFGLLTLAAGAGFGWIGALGAPGSVRSFLSVSTSLGVGAGQLGLLLGLGDHTQAAIDVLQPVGTGIGLLLATVVLWRCWRHDLGPLLGLGIGMGAVVLLSPVIQPWYLLWAALPLAASTADPRVRRTTIWLTAVFSVIIMPNGATIPVFTIVRAVAVAAVVVAVVLFLLARRGMPRSTLRSGETADGDGAETRSARSTGTGVQA
ncbi:polyprenol phosphomannose-dependent alpha 1,6 mannosyltransferase MptB [Nakamurella flavida]|uniref:Polyprenol phosphomannose-dependent alpha 1,6 mannosyltransferase MptB n=1 Tax=Nakamurella flavida TaxID=363630 RepID=A0A939BYW8_9ACTN|nr:polyprenol phosphomannose-dependent alpha 1,6 mannosyltransferase MptB [Nakamurella flavida]MBM9475123.1 polyprenol phosphomannose-dependent alpha 1,6 mannosyltransferase MptB [Nakamurella flavida]MDP9776693.1 alpha-1,6-mannosyltransferase [Nakamurella flavida]